jgi:adenosylcobinamide-GDP ribazoletransferase
VALLTERLAATFALMTAFPLARPDTTVPAARPAFFPLVGLTLGAGLVVIDLGLGPILPDLAVSALLVMALAVMTGAMHLDGLADSADGLFGGRDRDARLRIMDDPRNGAFGFLAIALVIVLKFATIASLDGWLRSGSLLLFPLISRTSVLWAMALLPPARLTGMGQEAARPGLAVVLLLTAGCGLVSSMVFFPAGAVLLLAALATTAIVGWYAVLRVGGMTGDVLGAAIEMSEVAVLLLAATSVQQEWLA